MASLLDELNSSLNSKKDDETAEILKRILSEQTQNDVSNKDVIVSLLDVENKLVRRLSSEAIAEWAKQQHNRVIFTDKIILDKLIKTLYTEIDDDIVIHSARAVANICFDNAEAGNMIDADNFEKVAQLLNVNEGKKYEVFTKISGMMVNVLTHNEACAKKICNNNTFNNIEGLLRKFGNGSEDNDTMVTYLLSIVNLLGDYCEELNVNVNEKFWKKITDVFKVSPNLEISVVCLEIFHGQSEKDDVLILLAKEGFPQLLINLIEKNKHEVKDEDTRSVLKMACDLVVIILTKDYCMDLLYDDGKGSVYQHMVYWVDSEDTDLLCSGVMAIGNFARKEKNCIQIVQSGISRKLIDLLKEYNSPDSDFKIQHAILSTLRNLVIPQQNKEWVLREGLIDIIYPMIVIDQFLVVFKLLGTIRMVIDGQESTALDLISRKDFLEKLVFWYNNSDHLGVRVEVPRLLSWLIKNCHSFKPFPTLLAVKDTVKPIVELMNSNFGVMQNEAFYALQLLCIGCSDITLAQNGNVEKGDGTNGLAQQVNNVLIGDERNKHLTEQGDCPNELSKHLCDMIIEADVGKHLSFVIGKYCDKMESATIDNMLTLVEQLIQYDKMIEHLNQTKVDEALAKIHTNCNSQGTTDRVNKLIIAIKK